MTERDIPDVSLFDRELLRVCTRAVGLTDLLVPALTASHLSRSLPHSTRVAGVSGAAVTV
jgi:hypothetical protein